MRLHRLLLAGALCLGGCDLLDDDEAKDAEKSSDADSGKGDAKKGDETKKSASKDEEDKGNVKLILGDDETPWVSKRARARIKDGKLSISASVVHLSEDSSSGRLLRLSISKYDGPGKYEIAGYNSSLAGVKLDLKDVKKAEEAKDETATKEATEKAATDAIKGGSVMLLKGAKVEVTKATDDFIDGTISWSGIAMNGPGKLEG